MDFKKSLSGKISKSAKKALPGRFYVTGDIAVVNIPSECQPFREGIADAIFSVRKDVKTVLEKNSKIFGERRTGGFSFVKGENRTTTVHKEDGYLYKIDLTSVFFSPKLAFERMRIASLITPQERIIIPFCGSGPFAIPSADRGEEIIGVEKNPDACRYFMENLKLNGLREKGDIICADALFIQDIIKGKNQFDRAIIPTAYGLDEALFKTSPLVKKEGKIHFYTFKTKEEIRPYSLYLEKNDLKILSFRRCGNIAPGVFRYVFDLQKKGLTQKRDDKKQRRPINF